jgi:hypothetical protein
MTDQETSTGLRDEDAARMLSYRCTHACDLAQDAEALRQYVTDLSVERNQLERALRIQTERVVEVLDAVDAREALIKILMGQLRQRGESWADVLTRVHLNPSSLGYRTAMEIGRASTASVIAVARTSTGLREDD